MEKKRIKVFIEKGVDDYTAFMDNNELSYSCIGQGATVDEAIEDFIAAYDEMHAYYDSIGKPFEEIDLQYSYDIPSFLQEYAYAFTLAGLERITGVNQKQLGHYISGYRKPSEKTIRKIEDGIHRFSEELSAVRFS